MAHVDAVGKGSSALKFSVGLLGNPSGGITSDPEKKLSTTLKVTELQSVKKKNNNNKTIETIKE